MANGEQSPMLQEMLAWKRRMDEADYDNEPVYVTPQEWVQMRAASIVDDAWKDAHGIFRPPPGPLDGFIGKPVIVDTEKAAEQRAKWRSR